MLLTYARVFLCGGLICLVGQLLLLYTRLTSARILSLIHISEPTRPY